jgi:hypothetical protein
MSKFLKERGVASRVKGWRQRPPNKRLRCWKDDGVKLVCWGRAWTVERLQAWISLAFQSAHFSPGTKGG